MCLHIKQCLHYILMCDAFFDFSFVCRVCSDILLMAMGANKVETKSRHRIHMTSAGDLETEVLPAEPQRSGGELLLFQLRVPSSIRACEETEETHSKDGNVPKRRTHLLGFVGHHLYSHCLVLLHRFDKLKLIRKNKLKS